ncbi:MAG TPA: class I lanthipeptide [Thermoanaerobaculia bacterium]
MKKSIKKLSLAKETLRNLNEEQLQDVAGGVKSKNYSDCGSCGIACTVIDCNP